MERNVWLKLKAKFSWKKKKDFLRDFWGVYAYFKLDQNFLRDFWGVYFLNLSGCIETIWLSSKTSAHGHHMQHNIVWFMWFWHLGLPVGTIVQIWL